MMNAREHMSEKPTWDQVQARLGEADLHARIEWFCKTYAPAEAYDRARWEADLMMLVRAIYMDAQKPLVQYITAIAAAIPFPLSVKP